MSSTTTDTTTSSSSSSSNETFKVWKVVLQENWRKTLTSPTEDDIFNDKPSHHLVVMTGDIERHYAFVVNNEGPQIIPSGPTLNEKDFMQETYAVVYGGERYECREVGFIEKSFFTENTADPIRNDPILPTMEGIIQRTPATDRFQMMDKLIETLVSMRKLTETYRSPPGTSGSSSSSSD